MRAWFHIVNIKNAIEQKLSPGDKLCRGEMCFGYMTVWNTMEQNQPGCHPSCHLNVWCWYYAPSLSYPMSTVQSSFRLTCFLGPDFITEQGFYFKMEINIQGIKMQTGTATFLNKGAKSQSMGCPCKQILCDSSLQELHELRLYKESQALHKIYNGHAAIKTTF